MERFSIECRKMKKKKKKNAIILRTIPLASPQGSKGNRKQVINDRFWFYFRLEDKPMQLFKHTEIVNEVMQKQI